MGLRTRLNTQMRSPQSVGDWLRQVEQIFLTSHLSYGHGTQSAHDEAAWLICSTLKIKFERLHEQLSRSCSPRESSRILSAARNRVETRAPLAYILGEAWLAGHRFIVDHHTIVPRSFLAEIVLDQAFPWIQSPKKVTRILDMCTGSGCLAILAGKAFPKATVDAVDISNNALRIAKKNILLHRLRARIRVSHSDLFSSLKSRRYDLILSNPPYVTDASMGRLPPEYLREPRIALEGGTDGLDIVARIVESYSTYLKKGGHLILELGRNRAAFEKRFPRLAPIWITTHDQENQVLMLTNEEWGG